MIFQATHQQVLNGTKTQTRRVIKPGESALVRTLTKPKLRFLFGKYDHYLIDAERGWKLRNPEDKIIAVFSAKGSTKWAVSKDYAVQPGRGKRSLGRTPPIKEIRCERLQEIDANDCRAEGITDDDISAAWGPVGGTTIPIVLRHSFRRLWNSLYRKPYHWEQDPEVWVLAW